MRQTNPAPEDLQEQVQKATRKWFANITPWLLGVGTWIFGGLIALNLLVLEALIATGPTDRAILVATLAFALALPLDAAGIFLLRLVQDLEHVEVEFDFENEVRQTIQETIGEQVTFSRSLEVVQTRRRMVVLYYSLGILTLSIIMTLAGMIAALWHVAWWIAIAFAVMVVISLLIVMITISISRPPNTAEDKAQIRRYQKAVSKRAKERSQTTKEQA